MDTRLLALPLMAIAACTSPSPPPASPAPPAPAAAPIAKAPETAPAKPAPPAAAKPAAPPAAKPAAAPPAVAAKPAATPPPKTAAAPPPKAAPASTPVAAAPAAPAAPKLDLKSLENRLKDTDAIGVMTKLSLKNQVDDLVSRFRTYHAGTRPPTLDQLRPSYDLLLMKVLSLLQDKDAKLASDIHASRDAIWSVLADPNKLAQFT